MVQYTIEMECFYCNKKTGWKDLGKDIPLSEDLANIKCIE